MNSNTQGNYEVRRTNNYLDLVEGRSYHATPITFAEFLTKPESLFFYEDTFFQIPGYIQQGAEIQAIEEAARKTVIQYIIDEFETGYSGCRTMYAGRSFLRTGAIPCARRFGRRST